MDLYTGIDEHTGTNYLLTVHDDGTRELATRPDPHSTWSPPVVLDRVPAETPC